MGLADGLADTRPDSAGGGAARGFSGVGSGAGAAAAEIAAMVGFKVELSGFPLQATVTEPVAPTIPHLVYSAAGKLTLKQLANGGCVIGGGWSAAVRSDGSLTTDPSNFVRNMAMACEVVPVMSVTRPLRSWTAWVNGTKDWRPIIGEAPNAHGFFLALFPWVGFSSGQPKQNMEQTLPETTQQRSGNVNKT